MELVKTLTEKALTLRPVDKIQLVEALLSSLDVPDPTIDKIWAKEAEKRYAAYKEGKLKAISWEQIKERYQ